MIRALSEATEGEISAIAARNSQWSFQFGAPGEGSESVCGSRLLSDRPGRTDRPPREDRD